METTCSVETSTSRKRKRLEESDDESESKGDIPNKISKWKEEHLQSLSVVVQYEENMFPSELLANCELQQPRDAPHSCIDKIIDYFLTCCIFHQFLDDDLASLTRNQAYLLRQPVLYSADRYLARQRSVSDDLQNWFRRFETLGVHFAESLYYTVIKRDLDSRSDEDESRNVPLTEADFQLLFDNFASMFGLRSFNWFGPCIGTSKLKLSVCEAEGKADIMYYQDVDPSVDRPLETLQHVIAVCEVKKKVNESDHNNLMAIPQQGSPVAASSSADRRLPPHISLSQLGQLGGKLLLYSQESVAEDVIFGILVQETKVSFTALKMTQKQYYGILTGRHEKTKPTLIITKPYDFMKKEDREHLIKPLLQLAMIQKEKYV